MCLVTKKSITIKQLQLTKCELQLSEIENIENTNKTDKQFNDIVGLNDTISIIKKEIAEIENNRHEIEYFTNTSHILYNYYELVEKNNDNNLDIHSQLNNLNKKSIIEYFHTPIDLTNDERKKSC